MKFMDKLKNIFFEEEEEEEIKEEKVVEITPSSSVLEEEVIARKVEVPKRRREVIDREEVKPVEVKTESFENNNVSKKNTEVVFDDVDFNFDIKTETVKKPEVNLYRGREQKEVYKKETPKYEYAYKETKDEKKTFTPSPIISPIYGILDKNYKKEEVKEKKEVRISSRPVKMDLDSVRNKAFGELENDLFGPDVDTEEEKKVEVKEEKKERRKIYDMTTKDKPSIDKVTLGEADEYFNDLGLAYNTDYKDISKEINDGKLLEDDEKKGDKLEDNLFDLIESMYDKED